MAQTIKLRRSSTAGSVPTTNQLALGEVAINTADGKLFIKKDVGGTESIVEIGAVTGSTANPQKLDDIGGSFNGSDTQFNLTVGSSAHTPQNALSCIISINGVIQEPTTAFSISGSQITFTSAPASGDEFYGVDLSTVTTIAIDASYPVGGGTDEWALEHDNTITTNYSISAGKNVVSKGPLTVNSGAQITVPNGTAWGVI